MRIATINDYTNPTAAQPSSYARNCPHLRMDFTGLSKSYNPFVSPRALALRRIAFLTIQFFHLTHLLFFTDSFSTSVSVLPATLLHIIFFVFTAWNLHLIVQMEGTRVVFGKVWGRGSFDVFLGGVVVSSGALLGWDFSIGGMEGTVEYSWFAADLLAILGVAWVATWEEGGAGVGLV